MRTIQKSEPACASAWGAWRILKGILKVRNSASFGEWQADLDEANIKHGKMLLTIALWRYRIKYAGVSTQVMAVWSATCDYSYKNPGGMMKTKIEFKHRLTRRLWLVAHDDPGIQALEDPGERTGDEKPHGCFSRRLNEDE